MTSPLLRAWTYMWTTDPAAGAGLAADLLGFFLVYFRGEEEALSSFLTGDGLASVPPLLLELPRVVADVVVVLAIV